MTDTTPEIPPPAGDIRITTISTPPASRWVIAREFLTDAITVAGTLYVHTIDPRWPWEATAGILAGVAGFHGLFKAAGKSRGGVAGLLAVVGTVGAWSLHKAPLVAAIAAKVLKVG